MAALCVVSRSFATCVCIRVFMSAKLCLNDVPNYSARRSKHN